MMTCNNSECPVGYWSIASTHCPGCGHVGHLSGPVVAAVDTAALLGGLRRTQQADDARADYSDGEDERDLVHSRLYEGLIMRLVKLLGEWEDSDYGMIQSCAKQLREEMWPDG